MGKVLWVDLTGRGCHVENLPIEASRRFIGGTGIASYLMSRLSPRGFGVLDPLGPQNPLIFATGPLTGTSAPTSGRYAVAAKSPHTGIWGESDSGGRWGPGLKAAGYDVLVITGRAAGPTYLAIKESGVEFRDASGLWGQDTYRTHDEIMETVRGEGGQKAAVACIGPAGEKLIPYAAVMSEGSNARAAGRCGLGAVMGSKNLKAVLVSGNRRPIPADPEGLRKSIREIVPRITGKTARQRSFGTACSVAGNAVLGDMSARNWSVGDWVDGGDIIGGEVTSQEYITGRYHCPTCVIGCGKRTRVKTGPFSGTESGAPEYETIAGFSAQCLVVDVAAIVEANDLCNRLGLDTISASGSIAFLMEAVGRGLVPQWAGGPEIAWGNAEVLIPLIDGIVNREGPGALISNGVRYLARSLGKEAEKFAVHARGLEFPYHDPRALSSLALAYVTHPRGACHRGCTHSLERFGISDLGYPKPLDRFSCEGKAPAVAAMQNYAELYNCLKLCQLLMSSVEPKEIAGWLNAVTGWDMDLDEFLKVGERSFNLKRLLNIECGVLEEEGALPERVMKEPFPSGSAANRLPDLPGMLLEYNRVRGWDESGKPSPEKLKQLGLA